MIKVIDLDKSLKEQKSKLLYNLPSWVVSILKKVVKQDELNYIINKFEGYNGVDFLPKVLEELNIKIQAEGLENLPENGKCFFVANHPFGIADGLILTYLVSQKYKDFKAIGNEAFMMVPNLRPVIAAVSVFGKNPKDYLMELEKVYNSDVPITHFPAGIVSRVKNFQVHDGKWEKSFIKKAITCERDIVPIFFHGRNSRLFYAIFMVRKALRININFELALLPRELLNKRDRTIRVTVGKPIKYTQLDDSLTHVKWAERVQQAVYSFKEY